MGNALTDAIDAEIMKARQQTQADGWATEYRRLLIARDPKNATRVIDLGALLGKTPAQVKQESEEMDKFLKDNKVEFDPLLQRQQQQQSQPLTGEEQIKKYAAETGLTEGEAAFALGNKEVFNNQGGAVPGRAAAEVDPYASLSTGEADFAKNLKVPFRK